MGYVWPFTYPVAYNLYFYANRPTPSRMALFTTSQLQTCFLLRAIQVAQTSLDKQGSTQKDHDLLSYLAPVAILQKSLKCICIIHWAHLAQDNLFELLSQESPDCVVHCSAQPAMQGMIAFLFDGIAGKSAWSLASPLVALPTIVDSPPLP